MIDTPIILKTTDQLEWRNDSMFYLVTADGLHLCRNTEFFTSSVKVDAFPPELANHKPFLKINCPKVPIDLFEMVVGFFDVVADTFGEAAVLIVYHKESNQVSLIVPKQECSWGSVDYDVPVLEPGWRYIGDIHSHVNMEAFSSSTDNRDEIHRPGLHLVVGKIYDKQPQFHCEFVVDGCRFMVKDLSMVLTGPFVERRQFPKEWKDPLTKKKWMNYTPWSAKDKDHYSHHSPYAGGEYD